VLFETNLGRVLLWGVATLLAAVILLVGHFEGLEVKRLDFGSVLGLGDNLLES
jgi:hypothetical protein